MTTRSPRQVATFPIVLRELTILRVTDVTPNLRRITLGGEQLRAFTRDGLDLPAFATEGFDDHVKFFFPAEGADRPVLPGQNISSLEWPEDERPISKDYTPHRFDPEAGEVDFDFVRHEGGRASAWAMDAVPGRPAWIAGPKMSSSHPEGVDWLLVLGDETALPSIGRWLSEMPAGTRAKVFVEVSGEADRLPLPTEADADIVWLLRDGAPAGTTTLLEDAVRGLEWLPGDVFVWAAGEALTLKPIRRHLVGDRGVPKTHLDFTGYWRRTEPEAPDWSDEEEIAHERLHELADLGPGLAIRAAVTAGLIELLNQGVDTPAELALRSGADPSVLEPLLDYLARIEILESAEGRYTLAPVGQELARDEHSAEEFHLGGIQAALDLSLSRLDETLRTGRPAYRTTAGLPVAAAVREDEHLAGSARAAAEDLALWVAPTLLSSYDWSSVTSLGAAGNGTGSFANALLKAFPELRIRISALPSGLRTLRDTVLDTDVLPRVELLPASTLLPPAGESTLLLTHQLDRLPDEDARQVLADTAALLPAGGRLLLVEETLPADAPDPLVQLQLRCAFGSARRPVPDITALAEKAGLHLVDSRELGWDHHLWILEHLT